MICKKLKNDLAILKELKKQFDDDFVSGDFDFVHMHWLQMNIVFAKEQLQDMCGIDRFDSERFKQAIENIVRLQSISKLGNVDRFSDDQIRKLLEEKMAILESSNSGIYSADIEIEKIIGQIELPTGLFLSGSFFASNIDRIRIGSGIKIKGEFSISRCNVNIIGKNFSCRGDMKIYSSTFPDLPEDIMVAGNFMSNDARLLEQADKLKKEKRIIGSVIKI